MEEATFLTRFASKVTLVHRRDVFRASQVMYDRAANHDKIEIRTFEQVKKWLSDESGLTGAVLEDPRDGSTEEIAVTGAFIAIGHTPITGFLEDQLETDGEGYLIHKEHTMTSVPGVFAAGDVVDTGQASNHSCRIRLSGCYRLRTLVKKMYIENSDGRLGTPLQAHFVTSSWRRRPKQTLQIKSSMFRGWRLRNLVIQYLAAAGIGHLTIVDDDVVEISNLQRQVIHRTSDVGVPKAQSAQRFVNELDPNISVDAIEVRVDQNNAKELFEGHHLIVDGTDNIPTRYLIDETCKNLGIPWVYGSVYRFEGQVSVFNFNGGPTYQDLFPEAPPNDLLPSCAEAGVLGVLPGLIGSLQANEVIKIIVEIGQPLSGQLLIYDALESTQKILKFGNSANEHIEEPSATQSQVMFHEIDSANAIAKMNQGWSPYFMNVRSEQENSDARIAKAVDLCPHQRFCQRLAEYPRMSMF